MGSEEGSPSAADEAITPVGNCSARTLKVLHVVRAELKNKV